MKSKPNRYKAASKDLDATEKPKALGQAPTYEVGASCANCGWSGKVSFPRGVKKHQCECPQCGCDTASPDPIAKSVITIKPYPNPARPLVPSNPYPYHPKSPPWNNPLERYIAWQESTLDTK